MTASEIDDIFSGKVSAVSEPSSSKKKGKEKAVERPGIIDSVALKKRKKHKKKKSSDSGDVEFVPQSNEGINSSQSGTEKKRKLSVVETVHDPSADLSRPLSKKRLKSSAAGLPVKKTKLRNDNGEEIATDDLDRFKDSRGTGPRKFFPSFVVTCLNRGRRSPN